MASKPVLSWKIGIALLSGVFAIVAALVGVAAAVGSSNSNFPQSVGLPILAITGLILLIATLALVAIGFGLFGISDDKEAFGLPSGSIRAAIALSLIVLFGIFGIYFYSTLATVPSDLNRLPNLSDQTAAAVKAALMPGQLIVDVVTTNADNSKSHELVLKAVPDAAAVDFAKQLMVTMGILITAISSFYFGSKATAPPAPAEDPANPAPKPGDKAAPSLSTVAPANAPPGTQAIKIVITGANLQNATDVTLSKGTEKIAGSHVAAAATEVRCDLSLPATASTGAWDIAVSGKDGEAKLIGKFSIP